MTNKNSHLNMTNEQKASPFLLEPFSKDYLWGGDRLKQEFGKKTEVSPLAESWECSTHKDGESIARSGEFQGKTLKQIIAENPQFLGTNVKTKQDIPILIKLIDANQPLSIQVHPDNEYANKHENGSFGKTELWYVLDALPGSSLYFGLHTKTDQETILNSIKQGNIMNFLESYQVKKDDVFFVKPGTIHALGGGLVVAEIQQSSNITYRLYDYDRQDKAGNKRELHLEKGLAVSNLGANETLRQPVRLLKYKKGFASELLCRSEYFKVERILLYCGSKDSVVFSTDNTSFEVFLVVEGKTKVSFLDKTLDMEKGDTLFVPANSQDIAMSGNGVMLNVSC